MRANFAGALAAGDVNGDGYADVAIGAPRCDVSGVADVGREYLFLGGAAGLGTAWAWTRTGAVAGDQFSSSAALGDADGDGFADLAVGAPFWDGAATNEGRVYLYRGAAAGPPSSPGWAVDPTGQASALFGFGFGSGGDVNGDGFDDLVAGAAL